MNLSHPERTPLLPPIDAPQSVRRRRWRIFKDIAAKYVVGLGGSAVIAFLLLIFLYLFYVVVPLFSGASAEFVKEYSVPGYSLGAPDILAIEEQVEQGVMFTRQAHAVFFKIADGAVIQDIPLNVPSDSIVSQGVGESASGAVFYGLKDGSILVVKPNFKVSYANNVRKIVPELLFPLGPAPINLDAKGDSITSVAGQIGDNKATFAGITSDGRVALARYKLEENLLEGTEEWQRKANVIQLPKRNPARVVLDTDQKELYVVTRDGGIFYYDISNIVRPVLVHSLYVAKGSEITDITFLPGGTSLLVATSDGVVTQWFPVRNGRNMELQQIRQFKVAEGPLSSLAPEYFRRVFAVGEANGKVELYHATSERHLLSLDIGKPARTMAFSPRSNALLIQKNDGTIQYWRVTDAHPEISWKSLWGKVWYEGYSEPSYVWQSTAANNDFEAKLSLVPIAFGTVKAAFYALLFAIPLAVFGAIFTAYFMAPSMRRMVKPVIEVMAALPSVILGFMAGLWLAPIVEHDLPAFFLVLLVVPLSVGVFAYSWSRLPEKFKYLVPEGWQVALLLPIIVAAGWSCFALSPWIEQHFMNGDVRGWLTNGLGIPFDQRNSMIVGIAMGFAVIPTIFSIAEDAIFGVPKHLTLGSLALGATPWQTLSRVVLLTASPGIFSAVMVGLGRAVGETMIVLMATGNTPVMDFSVFQGMRTLAANVAVEMPESEVASTHYRVLFLAALVLFMFTFVLNTIAEVVRQRLRKKYSSL